MTTRNTIQIVIRFEGVNVEPDTREGADKLYDVVKPIQAAALARHRLDFSRQDVTTTVRNELFEEEWIANDEDDNGGWWARKVPAWATKSDD